MIVLYTNHCPKCEILKQKLDSKGIEYKVSEDLSILKDLGISYVPVIETEEGDLLDFSKSIAFVNAI